MWLGPVLLKALIFFPLGSLPLLGVIVSCRLLSFTVTLKDPYRPYKVGATEYIYLSTHYVIKAIITISQLTFTGHQALAKGFNEAGSETGCAPDWPGLMLFISLDMSSVLRKL